MFYPNNTPPKKKYQFLQGISKPPRPASNAPLPAPAFGGAPHDWRQRDPPEPGIPFLPGLFFGLLNIYIYTYI